MLLLFFPLAARAAEYAWTEESPPRLLRLGLLAALCAALAWSAYPLLPLPRLAWQHATGRLPDCTLATFHCEPLQEVNPRAAPGDRVLMATHYGYWLRADLLQCRDEGPDRSAIFAPGEEQRGLETAFDRGFKFIIVDRSTHGDAMTWMKNAPRPGWLEVKRIGEAQVLTVFQLVSSDPGRKPSIQCRQSAPPAWSIVQAP